MQCPATLAVRADGWSRVASLLARQSFGNFNIAAAAGPSHIPAVLRAFHWFIPSESMPPISDLYFGACHTHQANPEIVPYLRAIARFDRTAGFLGIIPPGLADVFACPPRDDGQPLACSRHQADDLVAQIRATLFWCSFSVWSHRADLLRRWRLTASPADRDDIGLWRGVLVCPRRLRRRRAGARRILVSHRRVSLWSSRLRVRL